MNTMFGGRLMARLVPVPWPRVYEPLQAPCHASNSDGLTR